MGLLWNTELIQDQQTSWKTLWHKDYAGQILMPDNQRDCLALALNAKGFDINSNDPAELDAAFQALEKQQPLVAAYTGGEAYILMEKNLAAVMPCYSGDALSISQWNPALAFMLPAGGTFRTSFGYAISADTRKAEKAQQFVDYMCSVTNLAKNAVYSKYSVPSEQAAARLDSTWRNNPLSYPPESIVDSSALLSAQTPETRAYCAVRWAKLTAPESTDSQTADSSETAK
jgi:spermidine/putrescine transport system substrate-binding protein